MSIIQDNKIDFEELFDYLKNYFTSLKGLKLYSWIAMSVGVIIMIVSFII